MENKIEVIKDDIIKSIEKNVLSEYLRIGWQKYEKPKTKFVSKKEGK